MKGWNREEIEEMLAAFGANADPDDPKERKRQAILAAATELFLAQGYRKTSVDEVASRAGVAKGTVYLYFKNKAELMVHAVAREKLRYMSEFMEIISPDVPPRQRLRRWIQTALTLGTKLPLTAKVLSGDREILAVLYQAAGETMGQDTLALQHGFLTQMFDQAARPHSLTALELADRARVLFSFAFLSGQVVQEQVRQGLDIHRYAQILADMVIDGIGSPSAGGDPEDPEEVNDETSR